MKREEVKQLLHRYFDGESSEADERQLRTYFQSGNVEKELVKYSEFFTSISELADIKEDLTIEEDVMDFILESENSEKTRYRSMWKTVTGIAASIIIVLGGFLMYQEQQKSFEDSFKDPEQAYVYAAQTLQFVSGKYNKGVGQLSSFDKLRIAKKPIKKGTEPIIEFFEGVQQIEEIN